MSVLFPIRPVYWMGLPVYQLAARSALQGHCRLRGTSQHVTPLWTLIGLAAPRKAVGGGLTCLGPRSFATEPRTPGKEAKQVTSKAPGTGQGEVTIGRKVVQAGKDVSYMGIVVLGIGVTAIMFYAIGRELFASSSPSAVYTKAYKQCKDDPEIIEELGEPIKGFGETSRRGRRKHVSHLEYEQDGVKHMRMKFYIQGPKRKGTVHLEVKKGSSGKYEYRYLFAEMEGYPQRTVILEDNR